MKSIIDLFLNEYPFFMDLLKQHIIVSFISIILAIIFGIGIGIYMTKKPKLATILLSIVNVLYTIPAIALLGFLIGITGVGNTTAVVALTLYALLPVVKSTYVGLMSVDSLIIEAAEGMGSTPNQILYKIMFPLSLPILMSGIRNMVTMTIALAGIASFVGAGGLGVAIYRGITTNNLNMTVVGSLLIAILALVADFLLANIEKRIQVHHGLSKHIKKWVMLIAVLFTVIIGAFYLVPMEKPIHIATKPTTEGYVLGEMLKQLIEEKTDLNVKITHGVGGGTANIHPAVLKGEFDMYPEYTGTAWQVVLKHTEPYYEGKFDVLMKDYHDMFHLAWGNNFGFNDTYGIAVRKEIADQYQLKTYSDLVAIANQLTFGAEYDFYEREDGYKALQKVYDLSFKKTVDMDNGLKYQAIHDGKIDVMTIFTTDGQLSSANIVVLEDDKKLYPSYVAGTVVREDVLMQHPELRKVLALLNHTLDDKTMSELNDKVESKGEKPSDVAKNYLKTLGLIGE
ncbi:ABC transporter permease subunit [Granulicatella sp. zg-ZJ]|uniref:ABC transporter permease/substrate-binding protein n=1 Tax=Granulicatella sp. zg-ZJ TaxID=2678504 RepID=UPI0013D75387|nr:glycine betaine ABC transporter substrate-binding protein [Granulicatella sp. zg-ZJ]NEW61884.1 ABC transporter permease subunit [Granulicatella sp. zg-ZJ]